MESIEQTKTEKIIKALRKKLSKSGWSDKLFGFWNSIVFEEIIEKLQYYSSIDRKWIPGADLMFRFLYTCPYDKVKVVMLVDMTSVIWEMNDGIPMSCMNGSNHNKLVKTLIDSIPGQENSPKQPTDLAMWAKQGVLLIPIAVTAEAGKKGHYELWQPLVAYLIDHINHNKPQVPWVLLGTRAIECRGLIHTENVQERKFNIPFKEDGLWYWIEEQIICNNQIPIEWIK